MKHHAVLALSRAMIEQTEDREAVLRAAARPVPSTSTSPRRCSWCGNYIDPKRDRCPHCRQRAGTQPLVGLKRAS